MYFKSLLSLTLLINMSASAMQPSNDELALSSNDIHKLCLLEDPRNLNLTDRALEKINFLVLMRDVDVDTLKSTNNDDGTRTSERTPLFFAALTKKARTTRLLLQLGADRNRLNLTAEQQNLLADNEHQEVAAILRETVRLPVAEIDAMKAIFADRIRQHKLAKKRRVSTLHEAIEGLYPDLVENFIQRERPTPADFELALLTLTEPRLRIPANWPQALERARAILRCLAQHIPNVRNYRDDNGRGFLYQAVVTGIPDLVEILLSLGFDRDVQDNARRTPRDHAVRFGFQNIAELLRTYVYIPENFGDCPICLTPINHDEKHNEIGIRCACTHNFHLECLLPYVERQGNERKTCPVCRRNIVILDPIELRANNNIGLLGCNRVLTPQELANIQKLRSLNNVEISPLNRPVRSVAVPQRINPEFERPEVPELPDNEIPRNAAERALNGLPAQDPAARGARPALHAPRPFPNYVIVGHLGECGRYPDNETTVICGVREIVSFILGELGVEQVHRPVPFFENGRWNIDVWENQRWRRIPLTIGREDMLPYEVWAENTERILNIFPQMAGEIRRVREQRRLWWAQQPVIPVHRQRPPIAQPDAIVPAGNPIAPADAFRVRRLGPGPVEPVPAPANAQAPNPVLVPVPAPVARPADPVVVPAARAPIQPQAPNPPLAPVPAPAAARPGNPVVPAAQVPVQPQAPNPALAPVPVPAARPANPGMPAAQPPVQPQAPNPVLAPVPAPAARPANPVVPAARVPVHAPVPNPALAPVPALGPIPVAVRLPVPVPAVPAAPAVAPAPAPRPRIPAPAGPAAPSAPAAPGPIGGPIPPLPGPIGGPVPPISPSPAGGPTSPIFPIWPVLPVPAPMVSPIAPIAPIKPALSPIRAAKPKARKIVKIVKGKPALKRPVKKIGKRPTKPVAKLKRQVSKKPIKKLVSRIKPTKPSSKMQPARKKFIRKNGFWHLVH